MHGNSQDQLESPSAVVTVESYETGREKDIVLVLNSAHAAGWGDDAQWRWKHQLRPWFMPDEVLVACARDRAVGCFHSGISPFDIGEGIEVLMCFDCDLAIEADFRGRGIPIAVRDRSERRLFEYGVALRGGFTSEELNARFYEKQFDFIFVPAVTTEFRKFLTLDPLRPHIARLAEKLLANPGVRNSLKRRPLVVGLRIEGLPDSHLVLSVEGFFLNDGSPERCDISVRMPYILMAHLADGARPFAMAFVSCLTHGKIGLHGVLRSMPRLASLSLAAITGR